MLTKSNQTNMLLWVSSFLITEIKPHHCISLSFLTFDEKNNPNHYLFLIVLTFDKKKQSKPLYFLEFFVFLIIFGQPAVVRPSTIACPPKHQKVRKSRTYNGLSYLLSSKVWKHKEIKWFGLFVVIKNQETQGNGMVWNKFCY